ncbi:MarR family winged helix-turn-helix transcriptional regulator [Flaviaesturariibacter amylovorans]|uniref:HTH marR-type domain-containing protein n=1 Tax=Flaviaesturariibacter amylovorans TaxID=1084520 RepID=A0ABP8HDJ0_9BACT
MDEYINTGAYLRLLWDELRANMEAALQERGFEDVSPSHGWIFHHTKDEGSRITELAAAAHITKQSMSALVAQLEEAGYVRRKPDPSDKRAALLFLTAKGKKVRDAGRQINFDFEKKWEARIGSADYALLRKLLAQLCETTAGSRS